jgi:hypothetical protein
VKVSRDLEKVDVNVVETPWITPGICKKSLIMKSNFEKTFLDVESLLQKIP